MAPVETGVDGCTDTDGDGDATDGAGVPTGDPTIGLADIAGAELAGPVDADALAGGVLASAEDTESASRRVLEQAAAVAANTTANAAIAACDVVRFTAVPPGSFTSSVRHPTFIVNRRHRPRES